MSKKPLINKQSQLANYNSFFQQTIKTSSQPTQKSLIHNINQQQQQTKSRRQSYKYYIPKQVYPELKPFLIVPSTIEQKLSNYQKIYNQFSNILNNINNLYFIAIVIFQLILIILYITVSVSSGTTLKVILAVIIGITGVIYSLWTLYMTFVKKFLEVYWSILWLGLSLDLIFAAFAGGFDLFWLGFGGSLTIALCFSIWAAIEKKSFLSFVFICVFFIIIIVVQILLQAIIDNEFDSQNNSFSNSYPFFIIAIIFLFVITYDLYNKRWSQRTKHQKWQIICLTHILSILVWFWLVLTIPGNLTWIWVSMIINASFIFDCIYFFLVYVGIQIPCIGEKKKKNTEFLYQKSDTLLSYNHQDIEQSKMQQTALTKCIFCFNQQSRFCYQICLHVIVGYKCARQWLSSSTKKCPMCRQFSQDLLQIQRVKKMEFRIVNKYQFIDKK